MNIKILLSIVAILLVGGTAGLAVRSNLALKSPGVTELAMPSGLTESGEPSASEDSSDITSGSSISDGQATSEPEAGNDGGEIPDNVSPGNTAVFVNGREITPSELTLLEQSLGVIRPGSYWLDAYGNYGTEGKPAPLGNLYGGGSAPAGGGTSGDNFWSEGNFGAGNYNADNSQGYVSVPGYGPVDYGF